jgi:hypothetical protein
VRPYVVTPTQGVNNVLAELGIKGVTVNYIDGHDANAAAAAAKAADVAIVVVGTTSGEGSDRTNLSLPAWQDAMVAAVAAAQPKTIAVARCPGACIMPWVSAVPSILFQLMPGQEAGNALAAAVFGAINPSGERHAVAVAAGRCDQVSGTSRWDGRGWDGRKWDGRGPILLLTDVWRRCWLTLFPLVSCRQAARLLPQRDERDVAGRGAQ